MYKRLLAQEPFLRLLASSNPKRRKLLLQHATKEELKTLFEICLNIIKKNIPLKQDQFKKLNRYKSLVRELGSKRVTLKRKNQLIHQKGGAIGAVVGTVANLVLPLLASLLRK